RHLGAGADPDVELLARLVIELLRVVEPARHALGIEDDRRGHHRAGEWPPPRLVTARDRPDAALKRRALAPEGRTDVLLPERQAHGANGGTIGFRSIGCCPTHGAMVRADGPESTATRFLHVESRESFSEQAQLLRRGPRRIEMAGRQLGPHFVE